MLNKRFYYVSSMIILKSKVFDFFFIFLLCFFVTSFLSSYFSGRQPSLVSLDIGFSLIRLCVPFFIVFMVFEIFSIEFERRYYLNSMCYPVSRIYFFLNRFIVLIFFSLAMLMILAMALALVVKCVDEGYAQNAWFSFLWNYISTIGFIAVEIVFLSALAVLLSVIASGPSFILIGTVGFMIVARSYSGIVSLLASNSYLVQDSEAYREKLNLLNHLLPNLGVLDVRSIALYNDISFLPIDWPLHLARILIYTLALLALGLWALQRKRF